MFKRNLSSKDDSVAKRFRAEEDAAAVDTAGSDDPWGDDFDDDEIEKMDFIASQVTQEEPVFVAPKPKPTSSSSSYSPSLCLPSTSSGFRGNQGRIDSPLATVQSQMLASSADMRREIHESTQALKFDEFESNLKTRSLNSTFHSRQLSCNGNVILDDEAVEKWEKEKKKLLADFLTKEGETEFLRQQLHAIQTRAEQAKKEQAKELDEQMQKYRIDMEALRREKQSIESELQMQKLALDKANEKCKMLESGSIKFTQPHVNMIKANKDKINNMSIGWSPKKVKTKESSVQCSVKEKFAAEILRSSLILYPLKMISQYIFEPSETEKSVVDIKIEEKIGKRNLAIIQEEETFRIFENPELSKPKVTVIDGKNLTTEFFLPDLAQLLNKTNEEINSAQTIPIINKLVATTRELLLNSTLVLQKISQALQNDDIRDMNELYLSEFYEMPVPHTKSMYEARAWYDLERGVESRRAVGVLAHVALASDYLAHYIAGNMKLRTNKDLCYEKYSNQMSSYNSWYKKGFDFEFLDLILEFVTVVGTNRRSHQFTGLLTALMTLIVNVQTRIEFSPPGLNRVYSIFKEIVYSRPLLACFPIMCTLLNELAEYSNFVNKLCISPDKSGISYWKGSLNFTLDACTLEIFIAQLEHFKLDPITLINVTRDLASFSMIALLNNSIPWLEKTKYSCDCCLNLLKLVVVNLNECAKIDIEQLKKRYTNINISWRISKCEIEKKNKATWKGKLCENWENFEQNYNGNFWDNLKTLQYSAIAYGIRLLSFLAKRDLDFLIRTISIENAFHMFLNNLSKMQDLKLKKSDEIALNIVKKTFILEKSKDDKESQTQELNLLSLEIGRWTDCKPINADLTKLYEEQHC